MKWVAPIAFHNRRRGSLPRGPLALLGHRGEPGQELEQQVRIVGDSLASVRSLNPHNPVKREPWLDCGGIPGEGVLDGPAAID